MTVKMEHIIETLEQSEKIYQLLIPVMRSEKQAALGSNPRRLAEVSLEKEALLARLGILERERIRLIDMMADDLRVEAAQVSLSVLAEKADDHQRPRLTRLRDTFGGLIHTVRKENEENRALIQHCLDLTRGAMGFFQHWMMPVTVYGSSGRISGGQKSGKLISGCA